MTGPSRWDGGGAGRTPPLSFGERELGGGGIDNRIFPPFSAIFRNFPQFSAIFRNFSAIFRGPPISIPPGERGSYPLLNNHQSLAPSSALHAQRRRLHTQFRKPPGPNQLEPNGDLPQYKATQSLYCNPTPDSAADFGRITPNSGRIAGFLEFLSKLHDKVCRRRRRQRFGLRRRLKKWYFLVTFLNVFFGSLSLLDFFQKN
jgi:hypothetical protein